MDSSGTPLGYDYEYLRYISEYTGWKYAYVTGSWDECLSKLESGEIDLFGCVAYSESRAALIDYSTISAGTGGNRLICRDSDTRFAYGLDRLISPYRRRPVGA